MRIEFGDKESSAFKTVDANIEHDKNVLSFYKKMVLLLITNSKTKTEKPSA